VTRGVDARPVDARPSEAVLAELEGLCRRLRLRYIREQATEVLLTAKAQRWEPTELLRVLLLAEIDGRDASSTENRRKAARFPAGKTFDSWDPTRSSITPATQQALRSLEWVDRHENIAKAFTPILRADLVIVDDIGNPRVKLQPERCWSEALFACEPPGLAGARPRRCQFGPPIGPRRPTGPLRRRRRSDLGAPRSWRPCRLPADQVPLVHRPVLGGHPRLRLC
jgi:hypothetical protein